MNTYLIKSKVDLIKEAKSDFYNVYGIDYTPFTRKKLFYFFIIDGKKYVHKKSLQFVYSNCDCYTYDIDPYYCNIKKEYDPVDVIPFLESYEGNLLPLLLDSNEHFLVYEHIDGAPLESITPEQYTLLKELDSKLTYTPFYNSMTYNLVGDIPKLIDLKHFDPRDDKPFFIYFYNEDNCINRLYTDSESDLNSIVSHLSIDYPVQDAEIIYY